MIAVNTELNIEEKWYGVESVGRYAGHPSIFLYYGNEGVDKNYTVDSMEKEFNGWGWRNHIVNHGTHIVYSYLEDETKRDTDPLYKRYTEEITDFLTVQSHDTVRIHTPGYRIPQDEVDDVVDHYTVRIPSGKYKNRVESGDDVLEWFSDRDPERVDFVIGYDGYSLAEDVLSKFQHDYLVNRSSIWLYRDGDVGYDRLIRLAKKLGFRVSLPPEFFRDEAEDG